jgi:hypothetical protein
VLAYDQRKVISANSISPENALVVIEASVAGVRVIVTDQREIWAPAVVESVRIRPRFAMDSLLNHEKRRSAIEMSSEQFRAVGYELIDRIAGLLDSLPERRVSPGQSASDVRRILDSERSLPRHGSNPADVVSHAADLLFEHSLFNGHPRFWGYVTSSAAPIGALGELLAAAVNPNVGAWPLSPMASEIEAQTIRWVAELLNYPPGCGGLFLSGGNMANLVCFLSARQAKAGYDVRVEGIHGSQLRVYCSKETHTWVQKAADICGLGTEAIRWVSVDDEQRLDVEALEEQIVADMASGDKPFLVIGNAANSPSPTAFMWRTDLSRRTSLRRPASPTKICSSSGRRCSICSSTTAPLPVAKWLCAASTSSSMPMNSVTLQHTRSSNAFSQNCTKE